MSNQDKEAAWKLIQQAIKNEKSVSPNVLKLGVAFALERIKQLTDQSIKDSFAREFYRAETAGIDSEYLKRGFSQDQINSGRATFLEHMLKRPNLYYTEQYKPFENIARTNIQREIEERHANKT